MQYYSRVAVLQVTVTIAVKNVIASLLYSRGIECDYTDKSLQFYVIQTSLYNYIYEKRETKSAVS